VQLDLKRRWPARFRGPLGHGREARADVEFHGGIHDLGPVGFDVSIGGVIIGSVDGGVTGTEDFFLRQIDESVAAGVRPAEEPELDAAGLVVMT